MRRVLASVLVIVSLIGAVSGIAFAVFSDSASIAGNTISTGTVSIGLGGDGSEQTPEPITAEGLMPGDFSDWYRYLVTNESSENIKLYFYVTDVVGDACVKTNLDIRTGVKDGDEKEFTVYNSGLNMIKGVNNKVEITGSGRVFDPSMDPEDVAAVQMRAGLDLSASNNESTETCTWTGVFFAEGTTETPTEEPPMSFPMSFPEEDV